MPSLKMKTQSTAGCCLKEKNGLRVCQKSTMISKKGCSHVRIPECTETHDPCLHNCQDVNARDQVSLVDNACEGAVDYQEVMNDEFSQFLKQSCDFLTTARAESALVFSSSMETMFSPSFKPIDIHCEENDYDAERSDNHHHIPWLGIDDSDENQSSGDNHTCDVSDFYVSDMIVSSFPVNVDAFDDSCELNYFTNYQTPEPNVVFEVLPLLEDSNRNKNTNDESALESSDSDQAESFDPHMFIENLPELSDVVSNFEPDVLPKEVAKRKLVTLVLDLDETLVHSSLEQCDDADFTFSVFFEMKEHTVYVKKRPYLRKFLERVADMFDVIIFTASESIYAHQLLDVLDPEKNLISRRVYRESCIFSEGSYTKDLRVLGIDLAKVAIVDNSPQVFRLQVNNGIPIKSWFDDPSDSALISLLPFLETLVDVEDVRPIIAKKFGNKE